MNTNLWLAIAQIISVAVIPIIVWLMGVMWNRKTAKENAKRELFFTLMANRKSVVISKEWVDALNQIDVVFQDNKKVRRAWREYFDSLNEKSQYNDDKESFLLDLLSEMANSLGYKDLKQTEISRFYNPQAFPNQQQIASLINTELIRMLSHSKSYAEGFTDEEYNIHAEAMKHQ